MPVNLLCERCGKSIGNFPYDKVRDYVQANGETCKECLKNEDKLIKFWEREKNGYIRKLDLILEEAKQALADKINELANGIDNDSSGSS